MCAYPPGRVQGLHGVPVRLEQGGKVERGPPLAGFKEAGGGRQCIKAAGESGVAGVQLENGSYAEEL